MLYLCTRNQENRLHFRSGIYNAEIAQLVEHNLAKVGVASSSLVFRSEKQAVTEVTACFFVYNQPYLGYILRRFVPHFVPQKNRTII